MAFQEVIDALVYGFADEYLDEEEFSILYDLYKSQTMYAPLRNCVGFIDATVLSISRTDKNQRSVYNDHKRVNALKSQWFALLIGNLFGSVEGCRHDAAMLRESNILTVLERVAHNPAANDLCLYGDPAYPLRPQLMGPYCQCDVPVLTDEMKAFNKAMSAV
ncbi:Hypothetical predicted protein [Paramuricea clavata]|uniref:Uncharacterized protein n=1 Tax=Paramuricea clavata TaxID=317549 RepID=A0A6S7GB66_PARCT|nr:Hypothetical predicted protein [Paramuricea clavata]